MPILPTTKTPPKPSLSDLTVLWYGQTKIGKSQTCAQADGAVFLATEPGLKALEVFQVPILSWEDLLAACAEIGEGKHPLPNSPKTQRRSRTSPLAKPSNPS